MKIYVDGGARGNGTDHAECYGSFKVETEPGIHRLTFGKQVQTNNEAEYMTLWHALDYARCNHIDMAEVVMDSSLVVNQVNGKWKLKAGNLLQVLGSCRYLLQETRCTLTWQPREVLVRELGH